MKKFIDVISKCLALLINMIVSNVMFNRCSII